MDPSVGDPAFCQVHPCPPGLFQTPVPLHTPHTELNGWFPQYPCNWLPQTSPPRSAIPVFSHVPGTTLGYYPVPPDPHGPPTPSLRKCGP